MNKKRRQFLTCGVLAAIPLVYFGTYVCTLGCYYRYQQKLRLVNLEQSRELFLSASLSRQKRPKRTTCRMLPYVLTISWDDFPMNMNVDLKCFANRPKAMSFNSFTVTSLEVTVNGRKQSFVGSGGQIVELTFQMEDAPWRLLEEPFVVGDPTSTIEVTLQGEAVKADGTVVPFHSNQHYIMEEKTRFETGWGQLGSI